MNFLLDNNVKNVNKNIATDNMSQETQIQLFENAKIRVVWDDELEKYFFSVVDVISVLTESSVAKRYWTDLKRQLKSEGANETYEKIVRLKMPALDGKMRETDSADLEGILRIVQSIPSKKAEPLKRWLAQVGNERTAMVQAEGCTAARQKIGVNPGKISYRIYPAS